MSLLLAPEIDLQRRTARVRHILDCDATDPGCPLNFRPEDLRALRRAAVTQMLWGNAAAQSHTVPNLLDEMRATRVDRALVLPIAFGLPFGDDLSEHWLQATADAGAGGRLLPGVSVHPRDPEAVARLRRYAAQGARAVKLHPAAQRFFPDAPEVIPIYEECARLGLPVVFHGGRAGIEPAYTHQLTLMRHYEGALRRFPELPFVIGHAGARDVADAIPLAQRNPNAWLGIHGQGVTTLHELIERVGADRLLGVCH
jgi:predicted TIM-barrel fold metal-dependent hydrolase